MWTEMSDTIIPKSSDYAAVQHVAILQLPLPLCSQCAGLCRVSQTDTLGKMTFLFFPLFHFCPWCFIRRLQLCKLYLDRGQALVLAGWFSHKTFYSIHTHMHTERGERAKASQLVILDAAGSLSAALCQVGWLNSGSELVCFQPKSQWPATAALSVSFCLFCSSAQVSPYEAYRKTSMCQRRPCSGPHTRVCDVCWLLERFPLLLRGSHFSQTFLSCVFMCAVTV